MSRTQQLRQRRAMLVTECTLQRSILLAQGRQLGLSTGLISSGDGLLERFKRLPTWVSILLAAGIMFMPGRVTKVARTGLMAWQIWNNFKSATESKQESL
ncbi:hypothetical protein AAKU67_002118 [Oxalobacteraceae bacterium GrIS 2.11]